MYAATSRLPLKSNTPGFGSCRFQNTYVVIVFRPIARAFFIRSRQYSRGIRA